MRRFVSTHMRILITGASGSGTTTLGRAVAERLGWFLADADDYYWLPTTPPYQRKRPTDERLRRILTDLSRHESAVVSGSVMRWGAELEDSFDLIVFLYLDTAIRLERLRVRELRELGYIDQEFLDWASQYDVDPPYGRSLAGHRQWLGERVCPVLCLEGDLSVRQRCDTVIRALDMGPKP